MTAATATRHLGLDLGATNLKWAVVEHADGAWTTVARDQVPTRVVADPAGVPAAVVAPAGRGRGRGDRRVGARRQRRASACPACTTRSRARPGSCPTSRAVGGPAGRPAPWPRRPGVPAFLINDARAFGLAELRLGAGRGASSMVGPDARDGRGRRVRRSTGASTWATTGPAGELGHQTIDPDGPWCGCGNRGCLEAYARADQIAAACGTATAEEAVRARPGGRRAGAGGAGRGRAATWASGSATWSSSSRPTGS